MNSVEWFEWMEEIGLISCQKWHIDTIKSLRCF